MGGVEAPRASNADRRTTIHKKKHQREIEGNKMSPSRAFLSLFSFFRFCFEFACVGGTGHGPLRPPNPRLFFKIGARRTIKIYSYAIEPIPLLQTLKVGPTPRAHSKPNQANPSYHPPTPSSHCFISVALSFPPHSAEKRTFLSFLLIVHQVGPEVSRAPRLFDRGPVQRRRLFSHLFGYCFFGGGVGWIGERTE